MFRGRLARAAVVRMEHPFARRSMEHSASMVTQAEGVRTPLPTSDWAALRIRKKRRASASTPAASASDGSLIIGDDFYLALCWEAHLLRKTTRIRSQARYCCVSPQFRLVPITGNNLRALPSEAYSGVMTSERASVALDMRQAGASYREIAAHLAVCDVRARQLVLAALRKRPGFRSSLAEREAALDSIFLFHPAARNRVR